MKKIIRLGTKEIAPHNFGSVFCEITYEKGKLSIHGVIAPTRGGNSKGGCGQIQNSILPIYKYAPGWTYGMAKKFIATWNEWHLNDMQAGCEHQRARHWEDYRISPKELPNSHANRDEKGILAIWVSPKEHKDGLLGKPCPVCKYKYGTAWLTKEVPKPVIKFLESLPETDKNPAWV